MKKTLALAIVLASVITSAQTETTTAPAAAQPEAAQTAPVAKSKVKKAKKKKSKAGAANDSMTKPVPAVTSKESATATPTISQSAADAGKTVDAQATAAGTSTIATSDVAAPTRNLKGFVNVYSTNDTVDTSFNQTLTSLGGSYKFNDKLTLKIGEAFETLTKSNQSETAKGREMIEQNNFRPSHMDINVAATLPGMFGSKDQSASLTYRAMGSDAVYTTEGGYKGVLAMYEANLSTPFVINTKWDVNVFSQIRHVVNKGDKVDSNRVLAVPYVTYTINDTWSVYQAGGLIYSFQDNMDLRRKYERIYLETGVNFTVNKNLSFSADISQDKAIASADPDAKVSAFNLYSSNMEQASTLDAVAYEAYINYSF